MDLTYHFSFYAASRKRKTAAAASAASASSADIQSVGLEGGKDESDLKPLRRVQGSAAQGRNDAVESDSYQLSNESTNDEQGLDSPEISQVSKRIRREDGDESQSDSSQPGEPSTEHQAMEIEGVNSSPEQNSVHSSSPAETTVAAASAATASSSWTNFVRATSARGKPLLYKDAVQSCMKFLTLSELGRCASVNHLWQSAIQTMRPLRFALKLLGISPISVACSTTLARHIRRIDGIHNTLLPESFAMIRMLMPQVDVLTKVSLKCREQPYLFPLNLRVLELVIRIADATWEHSNKIIEAIGQIRSLKILSLVIPVRQPSFPFVEEQAADFTPLTHLQELNKLDFAWDSSRVLTENLLTTLRAMPSLQYLDLFRCEDTHRPMMLTEGRGCLSELDIDRITATPHRFTQLKHLGFERTDLTRDHLRTLLRVPSLTSLLPRCVATDDLSLLSYFPNLTRVWLLMQRGFSFPIQSYCNSIRNCPALTSIGLSHSELTHSHLTSIFESLPNLRSIMLFQCEQLTSLRCFKSGTICNSLEELRFSQCRAISPVELFHLHGLNRLTLLSLVDSFTSRLDEHTRAQYESTSVYLQIPSISSFTYEYSAI